MQKDDLIKLRHNTPADIAREPSKDQLRAELEQQINEFMAKGGRPYQAAIDERKGETRGYNNQRPEDVTRRKRRNRQLYKIGEQRP